MTSLLTLFRPRPLDPVSLKAAKDGPLWRIAALKEYDIRRK
eukprot:gene33671-41542_t